jgi:hypothetical protein
MQKSRRSQKLLQRVADVEAAMLSMRSADVDDAVSLLLKVLKRWNK